MENQTRVTLPPVGTVATGTVVKVFPTYALLLFDDGWTGLLHISELSHSFIRSFTAFVTIGTIYSVKVIAIDSTSGKIHVSLKAMSASDRKRSFSHAPIVEGDISFDSLRDALPGWIIQQNKELQP